MRAPLRISLGGGGTDLPSHFRTHGGFVVSAAIDRYVRVRISNGSGGSFRLDHMELEQTDDVAEITHPILRAAITRHWAGAPFDLVSEGDVPPGTGLGSSGAYTVATVKALALAAGRDLAPSVLAEEACTIELDDLGRTVGKQDQYAAAYGGVNALSFGCGGDVGVHRLDLDAATRRALQERFLLFGAGGGRSAADILAGQVERAIAGDTALERNLFRTEELAHEACVALERGEPDHLGELMEEQWALKRERLPGVAMEPIEDLRAIARRAGASGATLVGAGGGGFLLVCAGDPERVRAAFAASGVSELTFGLDDDGCVAA